MKASLRDRPATGGKTRTVLYHAAGGTSGLTVQCDVYRPDTIHDEEQSGQATEVEATPKVVA